MAYIEGEPRGQRALFPTTLDELIPEDHVCSVILNASAASPRNHLREADSQTVASIYCTVTVRLVGAAGGGVPFAATS